MDLRTCSVVELQPQDDLASVRHRLDWQDGDRIALVLPWEKRFPSSELDFGLLRREAEQRKVELAIVSADPELRRLARKCGFPAFPSAEWAQETSVWRSRSPKRVAPPRRPWWKEEVALSPRPVRPRPSWLYWIKKGFQVIAFLLVLSILAGSAYTIIPSAEVTLVPAGKEFVTIVPVSVDLDIEEVVIFSPEEGQGGIIPARRVGVEVEGNAEVETTGTMSVASGRATGEVMFTSLLAQDYVVRAGTIVRTSSTSYPIRFRTNADVAVPAGGQATAPIEALEGGLGNVGMFQINRVEGVAASAVRVINPAPTSGAEAADVRVVVQDDYERVRQHLTQQLLDQAYVELGSLLEPSEFLPRQSLRIEAVPKKAYTRFITEPADTVGLNMRLLVSGQAVDVDDAEGIAYAALARSLPPGYALVDAHFEVGEVAEEDIGSGWFAFFVTARGYAAAALDTDAAVALVQGERLADAREQLQTEFPLAEAPRITLWPEWPERLKWLERMPLLPLRINVHVAPQGQQQLAVSEQ
jgi:hypothetical protein